MSTDNHQLQPIEHKHDWQAAYKGTMQICSACGRGRKHPGYKPRCGWCGRQRRGIRFATMRGVHGYYCESCLMATVL